MIVERDFAGAKHRFRLGFGEIMDLEQACDGAGIATIYKRMGTFDWHIGDVFHVLKRALVGGGMTATEAEALVKARIDAGRLGELMTLAYDVLISTIEGAPQGDGAASEDTAVPFDRGLIYKNFAEVGVPPQEVDAMPFAKALMLFEAMGRDGKAAAPTVEEFREMRARVETGALDWSLQPDVKGTPEEKEG